MGIGVISLATSQKREIVTIPPPGPPFTSNSAENGLSVSASGTIVLGNDVGDVTAPARLLNNRTIQTQFIADTFSVILDAVNSSVQTLLSGREVRVVGADVTTADIFCGSATSGGNIASITCSTGLFGQTKVSSLNDGTGTAITESKVDTSGTGGLAVLRVGAGNADVLDITAGDIVGRIQFRVQGLFTTMMINTATLCTLIQSDTPSAFNNATLQVSGTHTYRKFPQSQNGVLNLNRDTDSAKVLRNSGALTINFPNMVGANFREGFFIDVLVNDAAGITINAGAATTIKYGDLATSVNGTISSTSVGAFIRIIIIDGSTYATCFSIGLWILT